MADALAFRIKLVRSAEYTLFADARIPLTGVTAIAGPSGGGKTTLLRALAGLERCEAADIRFGNTVWNGPGVHVPPEARRIGFVFQRAALFPHLSVADNVSYGARRRDVRSFDAIVDALDLGRLMPRAVSGLSGGEARRVALGRALASDPAILFLDEPLAGLDRARQDELLPYIGRAVAEAKVPAIIVTHSQHEITTLADRVLGLEEGGLTGWKPAPVRLMARVASVSETSMRLRIEGAPDDKSLSLTVPRVAVVGERIGLGLNPENLLISAGDPGRSDAILRLPARVVESADGLTLDVFGQTISLARGGPFAIGSSLWLSVLSLGMRLEGHDSE